MAKQQQRANTHALSSYSRKFITKAAAKEAKAKAKKVKVKSNHWPLLKSIILTKANMNTHRHERMKIKLPSSGVIK